MMTSPIMFAGFVAALRAACRGVTASPRGLDTSSCAIVRLYSSRMSLDVVFVMMFSLTVGAEREICTGSPSGTSGD